MGLDMYAFMTKQSVTAADFETPSDSQILFYWRKHPNLHGWIEALYRSKGGRSDTFNTVHVRLDPADLDALERVVRENTLPATQGFFFGASDGSEKSLDEDFIRKARDAIAQGKFIYYTSWW
jgi:hypothetical protein